MIDRRDSFWFLPAYSIARLIAEGACGNAAWFFTTKWLWSSPENSQSLVVRCR